MTTSYLTFTTMMDGIEMIGLNRLKEDIEALSKHKINGAKGGKKRAENYRKKQQEDVEEERIERELNFRRILFKCMSRIRPN